MLISTVGRPRLRGGEGQRGPLLHPACTRSERRPAGLCHCRAPMQAKLSLKFRRASPGCTPTDAQRSRRICSDTRRLELPHFGQKRALVPLRSTLCTFIVRLGTRPAQRMAISVPFRSSP